MVTNFKEFFIKYTKVYAMLLSRDNIKDLP